MKFSSTSPIRVIVALRVIGRLTVCRIVRLRGFGDITVHGHSQRRETASCSPGQLTPFVTGGIAEKFKFRSEIVFEGGSDNIGGETRGENNSFSVDVERMVPQYSRSDYL